MVTGVIGARNASKRILSLSRVPRIARTVAANGSGEDDEMDEVDVNESYGDDDDHGDEMMRVRRTTMIMMRMMILMCA